MEGYISINRILDDINEHPLLRDVTIDRVIHYTMLLIKICGMPNMYIDKTAIIKIDNYRGVLPCDFMDIASVRGLHGEEYVVTMNDFHTSPLREKLDNIGTFTYKILGNIIFTSLKDKDIEVTYRTIPFDENGFPLIPDREEFIRAIEAYIKLKRFTILFDMLLVPAAVYQLALQDYAFYIGLAQTDFIRPTEDLMLTIANMWCKLIPDVTAHRTLFAVAHNREILRNH